MFFLEIKISSGYVGNDQCRKSFYNPKNCTLITNNPHLLIKTFSLLRILNNTNKRKISENFSENHCYINCFLMNPCFNDH